MLPYQDGLNERFWSKGVRAPLEEGQRIAIHNLSDIIDKGTLVSSAGSCFAQNIGKNLLERNYSFLQTKFCTNPFQSFGLGNIYTTRQLYQWLEFCNNNRIWSEHTFFEDPEGQFLDYLIPKNDPVSSLKAINETRKDVALEFVSTLKASDVFIFTCGLTECCETMNNEVLAIAPGTLFGSYDPNIHQFINFNYPEILDDLKKIEKEITHINPEIKFIYTVSPVPLTATSGQEHVLVANNFSKSTIRAAVGDHVRSSRNTFYFPSYELITHNTLGDWRFETNLRNVSAEGVNFVLRHGLDKEHYEVKGNKSHIHGKNVSEVVCEEEKLETFNRVNNTTEVASDLFLIGDSHFGKYAKFLSQLGVNFHGGQIMSASGFTDNKFVLDRNKIFNPIDDEASSNIWGKTFDALKKSDFNNQIYTNIGFQTHRTIPFIMNHFRTSILSLEDISVYFSKFFTNTLTVLSKLGNYGSVTLVEDPNIYIFLDESETPVGTNVKLLRANFLTYCSYMKRLSDVIGYNYLSPYDLIFPDLYKDTKDIKFLVGDDFVHSSELFYQKFASFLQQENCKDNPDDGDQAI